MPNESINTPVSYDQLDELEDDFEELEVKMRKHIP